MKDFDLAEKKAFFRDYLTLAAKYFVFSNDFLLKPKSAMSFLGPLCFLTFSVDDVAV